MFFRRLWPLLVSFQLNAMHATLQVPTPPTDIVISDEFGPVERLHFSRPTTPLVEDPSIVEKELHQWVIRELMERNKDLQEQLKSAKTKWYIAVAGVATTVIPLVVCSIELYNSTHDCD
jgi:hypothetical protein